MTKNWIPGISAMVGLLLVVFATAGVTPAAASTQATPTGCTTSVQWVQQGSSYWYGKGNVTCATGRYKAKNVCRNQQSGDAYVLYGTQAVNAPGTATVTCYSGNVAEAVHAVEDPPGIGLTGCVTWSQWVLQGNNYFYGRANAQCDTGQYRIRVTCHNMQTGQNYVITGSQIVTAPTATTVTCYTGNVVQSAQAVAA